jgi:hypothetical protein
MRNRLIEERKCHLLIEDAVGNTNPVPNKFKKMKAGLWVRGIIFLTNKKLTFKSTIFYDQVYLKGKPLLHIPLSDILEIRTEFGFLIKTIHLFTKDSVVKLRCWDAQKFSSAIHTAIANGHT